jgi:NAD(P)-dependent dehydrogenase (short-subunit alcohol dehydrogenase family)
VGIGEKMKSGNHIVVITGATRGLGRLVAQKFWDTGSNVVLIARNEGDLKKTSGDLKKSTKLDQDVHYFSFDLSDIEGIPKLCQNIQKTIGDPDILINNAAIQGPIGPIYQNDWEEWMKCLNICLLAPVRLTRELLPGMIENKFGRIVNISGGGVTAPRPNFSSYATAKCGLIRFSETLAGEVAKFDILVNCVAPGSMNSELTRQILNAGKEHAGQKEFDSALQLIEENPETDKRAAELVYFLATSPSININGKLISAVWDPWEKLSLVKNKLSDSDVYTLRRIIPEDRGLNIE